MKSALHTALLASTIFLSACSQSETAEDAVSTETTEQETKMEKAEAPNAEDVLSTTEQKLSYLVGTNIAKQFKRDGIELDIDALILAVQDITEGRDERLSEEQIQAAVQEVQAKAQERAAEQAEKAGEANKVEGVAYLEANGKKEGVNTTESGLQYKVLSSGDGDTNPTREDTVTVHYTGKLINGTVFDSSVQRGQPASFPVSGVIPGWTEALQLMKVGDKWELTIPSEIAYGTRGAGGDIGPNSVLIFEVELLDIAE